MILIIELILFGAAGGILFFFSGLWLGTAIFGLIGLILLILVAKLFKELRLARELDRDGVTAAGVVKDKWVSVDDSDPENTSTYHYVSYQFGDQTYRQDNQAAYEHLEIGSPVTVRYLPRDRNIARLEL
jgi:hypothetical protein